MWKDIVTFFPCFHGKHNVAAVYGARKLNFEDRDCAYEYSYFVNELTM